MAGRGRPSSEPEGELTAGPGPLSPAQAGALSISRPDTVIAVLQPRAGVDQEQIRDTGPLSPKRSAGAWAHKHPDD